MGKDGYQKVANKKDLQEGSLLKVEPEGKPIVLSLVNGKVYAMDAVCSHEGGPLEEGTLEGYNLTCPWHYAIFDVRNAKVSDQTVWATDLNSYAVQVEEATGDILISLDTSVAESSEQQQQKPSTIIQRQQNEQQDVEVTKADSKEKSKLNEFELVLLEKQKYNETDVMSFKFSKQDIEQKKELDYISGQYAFFDIGGVYNDPEGPLRHFTIASSPTENFIMISTRIRDTPYKKRLSSLEEEKSKVKVRGPTGKFILHEDYSKPAVLLSGGIGVTPFRSMIKYATDKQLPIKIVMFDSNRDEANILYKNEFDECLKNNKNLKIIYTITGEGQPPLGHWEGEAGRIDMTMITKYVSEDELNKS
ncbi:MAG TPA: Rieske 2Fe-2S domain-containing protein, partial [Nitrososphaeraceae archaeon]|nr:Rieske 2Fe-2S domain-containing protein [Nitrososphaeraceae archaeon]